MATRKEIVQTFYSDLQSAATGTGLISDDQVLLHSPDVKEELPTVTYDVQSRDVNVNSASSGPYKVDGNTMEFHGYTEAMFTVQINAGTQQTEAREDLYEAIRSEFGKYEHASWPARDFHEDVDYIHVTDSSITHNNGAEHTVHEDALQVFVQFHRVYEDTSSPLAAVDVTAKVGESEYIAEPVEQGETKLVDGTLYIRSTLRNAGTVTIT